MQVKINRDTYVMSITVFPEEMPGLKNPQTRQKVLTGRERELVRRDSQKRPGDPCPFKLKLKLRLEAGKAIFGFRLVEKNDFEMHEAGTVKADDVAL